MQRERLEVGSAALPVGHSVRLLRPSPKFGKCRATLYPWAGDSGCARRSVTAPQVDVDDRWCVVSLCRHCRTRWHQQAYVSALRDTGSVWSSQRRVLRAVRGVTRL
jgi:hypothetical protein